MALTACWPGGPSPAISLFLRDLALSTGTTLATVGSMHFEPNVINVIPRKAVFTVDLRDPEEARLQAAEKQLPDCLYQSALKGRLASASGSTDSVMAGLAYGEASP